MGLLLLASLIAAVVGFMFVSEATMGVAIIGIAVWLAALGRIAQADKQHNEQMAAIRGEEPKEADSSEATAAVA